MSDNFEKQYDKYFESHGNTEIESDDNIEASSESVESDAIEEPNNVDEELEAQEDDELQEDNESPSDSIEDEPKKNDIANNLKIALKEERTKRQESDKRMQMLEEQFNQTRQALESLLSPKQQEQIPNYEEDPLGYLKWQQEQTQNTQAKTQQYIQQQAQQQEAYNYAVGLNNEYLAQKAEVVKSNPDFENVANFLENSVVNEYRALGMNDNEIQQRVIQDKIGLLQTAKDLGISSTDMIANLAKARGYVAKPNATNKLSNIKKGQERSKSLGQFGEAPTDKLSLKEISKLDDKEFSKMWSQYKRGDLQL
jgi:hypothetical protein